jgi:hypothetical protein
MLGFLYLIGCLCLVVFLFTISPWLGGGAVLLFIASVGGGLQRVFAPAKEEKNSPPDDK